MAEKGRCNLQCYSGGAIIGIAYHFQNIFRQLARVLPCHGITTVTHLLDVRGYLPLE
jgi:hypothetical protein